jgi:hypothetical protein
MRGKRRLEAVQGSSGRRPNAAALAVKAVEKMDVLIVQKK